MCRLQVETAAFGLVKCFIYSQLSQITDLLSFVQYLILFQSKAALRFPMEDGRVRRDFLLWCGPKRRLEAPSIPAVHRSLRHPAQHPSPCGGQGHLQEHSWVWGAGVPGGISKEPRGHCPGTAMLPSTGAAGGIHLCSWEQGGLSWVWDARWLHLPKSPFCPIPHLVRRGLTCQPASPPHATVAGAPLLLLFPLAA